jgi:hypothetical protein
LQSIRMQMHPLSDGDASHIQSWWWRQTMRAPTFVLRYAMTLPASHPRLQHRSGRTAPHRVRVLTHAISTVLLISLTAPSVAMAVEGTAMLVGAEHDTGPAAAKHALPDLGSDTAPARDDLLDRTLGWLASAGSAGADGLTGHVVNQGLTSGIDGLRDSGLPFLGGLQGGIQYDRAGSRFSYDLLTVNRFHGNGSGHHWLAQLGAHNQLDRPTANVGLIYRWVHPDQAWLVGGNLFYDRDFDTGAQRIGTGAEAVTANTRLYANVYRPLGDRWYVSPNDELREERAASGYDLGVTYTPSILPMLDFQLQGARWDGDEVDVFGNGQYLRDPTVWSAKIGYTPMPLITLSAEQEKVAGGDSNTRLGLAFNYRFGVPLSEQTRATRGQRTDIGFRALAPVERENRIVTESRERYAPLVFAGPGLVQATVRANETFVYPLVLTGGKPPYVFTLSGADAHRFEVVGQELRLRPQTQTAAASSAVAAEQTYAVTVTGADTRGRSGHQSFELKVLAGTAPVAQALAIAGSAQLGATLTGSFTYADADGDAAGGHRYQWYRASDAAGAHRLAIAGATATTYTIGGADQGHHLVFEVTPVSANGEAGSAASTVTAEAVPGNAAAPVATEVAIDGVNVVGAALTGRFSYADGDGDAAGSHTYQWYRAADAAGAGRTAIEGATAVTYTIAGADQGQYLVFEVTPVSARGEVGTAAMAVTSAPVATVLTNAPVARDVAIAGATTAGTTLTGSFTYEDADGDQAGAHQYRWYRASDAGGANRSPIAGQNTATYTITAADQGQYLVFEVVPKSLSGAPDTGTAVSTVTAASVTGAAAPEARNVQVTGATTVGSALAGSFTYFDADSDPEGTHTYQWYRASDAGGANRVPIGGATAATYTITGADQGHHLVFEVTPTSASSFAPTGTAVRAVTPASVTGTAPVASAVAIGGTAEVGATVTGSFQYTDAEQDAEGTHLFQWYRATDAAGANRVAIPGATGRTHAVTLDDHGQFLVFEVTPVSATGIPAVGQAQRSVTGTPAMITVRNDVDYAIPPGNVTVLSPLAVSGVSGTGTRTVTVRFHISHDDSRKLFVNLRRPGAAAFSIWSGALQGSLGDDVHGTFSFDVPAGEMNGEWELQVAGIRDTTQGRLNSWTITF